MDDVRVLADLTTEALWFRYVALTGTGDLIDLDGYLHGLTSLESGQQVVLAQALNEALDDGHGARRFPMPPPARRRVGHGRRCAHEPAPDARRSTLLRIEARATPGV